VGVAGPDEPAADVRPAPQRRDPCHLGERPVTSRPASAGGGNSAGQAATALAAAGHRVYVLVRGDGLAQTMSAYLLDRIEHEPLITVHPRTVVVAVHGDLAGPVGILAAWTRPRPSAAVALGGRGGDWRGLAWLSSADIGVIVVRRRRR